MMNKWLAIRFPVNSAALSTFSAILSTSLRNRNLQKQTHSRYVLLNQRIRFWISSCVFVSDLDGKTLLSIFLYIFPLEMWNTLRDNKFVPANAKSNA